MTAGMARPIAKLFVALVLGYCAVTSFPKPAGAFDFVRQIKFEVRIQLETGPCQIGLLLRATNERAFLSGDYSRCRSGRSTPGNSSQGKIFELGRQHRGSYTCSWKKGGRTTKCTNGDSYEMPVAMPTDEKYAVVTTYTARLDPSVFLVDEQVAYTIQAATSTTDLRIQIDIRNDKCVVKKYEFESRMSGPNINSRSRSRLLSERCQIIE